MILCGNRHIRPESRSGVREAGERRKVGQRFEETRNMHIGPGARAAGKRRQMVERIEEIQNSGTDD